jgi:hypothetical protein
MADGSGCRGHRSHRLRTIFRAIAGRQPRFHGRRNDIPAHLVTNLDDSNGPPPVTPLQSAGSLCASGIRHERNGGSADDAPFCAVLSRRDRFWCVPYHQRVDQDERRVERDKETPMAGGTVGKKEAYRCAQPAPRHDKQGLPKGSPPEQERRADHGRPQSIRPGKINRRIAR